MKRSVYPLALLSIVLCGCGGSETPASPTDTQAPETHETPTLVPSQTPEEALAISCDQFSLDLNPAPASDYTCAIVPEFDDGMRNPQYIRIGLDGYPLSGDYEYSEASISVYPVQEFAAMFPDPVVGMVADLEALTSGSSTPDEVFPPYLISWEASQFFYALYAVVPFTDGDGIRYLTGFTQDIGLFDNHTVIYTYQAMTDDGRYWISADFMINIPMLPATESYPPGGWTSERFEGHYGDYFSERLIQLEGLSPGSLTPSITDLDALVSSITIEPWGCTERGDCPGVSPTG